MARRFVFLRCMGLLTLWLVTQLAADAAPVPLHAYEFNGDLSDSGTGATPILSQGGVAGSEFFEFDPTYPGDTFPDDIYEGLTLENPQLTDFGVYTIEMRMKFDILRNETPPGTYGEDQGWIKVLDFTNNEFSQGLYVEDVIRWEGPGEEGKIEFIASGGRPDGYDYVGVSPDGVIKANAWFHTVLTRDSSGMVACYLDGEKMFEFEDVWDDAVLDAANNSLNFMQPDSYALTTWPYPVIEVTQGDLDYMRIYDQALTEEEAIALFEPMLDGDYNGNGVVDAVDYAVWRNNFGSTIVLPNDPIGGTIGLAQYETWRAHYGAVTADEINAVASPEPASGFLVLAFIGFTAGVRLDVG